MGSSKKHKKDRDSSSKRRSRSRSRSRSDENREKRKSKKQHREKERETTSRRQRSRKSAERERSYHSDSELKKYFTMKTIKVNFISGSDVVEVPMAPEPPVISKPTKPSRSPSPIPAEGAGDCLSIEATNKLRAKLGLKPLEVGPSVTAPASSRNEEIEEKDEATQDLKKVKDDWGEFYHKPAGQFNEKSDVEKLREKIQSKRDKRKIEQKLASVKTLGESDSDDDPAKWVEKNRKIQEEKKKAIQRSKMFEEMDEEMDVTPTKPKRQRESRKRAYGERDLKGLKVAHDIENFTEDRHVILTLKDQDVLGEDGDTLINVNMIENERYKKNIEVRKQNPNHYGYDVYEEQYDEFGNFIQRGVLGKYDDEIDGNRPTTFTLGESKELLLEQQRKAMEIKAKLQGKTLESLNVEPLRLASDHYTEEELTKFKKPKKKVKKIRRKFKADDLLELAGDVTEPGKDLGSRKRRDLSAIDLPPLPDDSSNFNVEADDDDLEQVLNKARRLRQKENIIKKDILADSIKAEVKEEVEVSDEEGGAYRERENGYITLNQTAEFCRTLGDIPTYGMAGNRDDNADIMDIEENSDDEETEEKRRGKWNAVDPNDEPKPMEGIQSAETDDKAILDEEPDVASGVAAALQLAMSKGYIEKEESNRPSNTRFAHLQAQHYSIDDKAHGEDDKYARRGNNSERFNGPTSEFREKPGYKPNVKLEYIDDNNQKLTPKEAFRYLSHKFHGKGPGKNKIEKRLKKLEEEAVSKHNKTLDFEICNSMNLLSFLANEENVIIRHTTQHPDDATAKAKGNAKCLRGAQWQ